jgi:flagellin
MTIAISSQMASSLVALTNTADDISKTQNRLATGLAVATASDNIAVYFKAKSYSNKAEDLDTTNKGISQAVANLDTVDKAMSNMQDNLKGALQLIKDARAKAVTTTKVATLQGDQSYATTTVGGRTVKGDIVQAAGANANSSAYFQVGDVFAVNLTDSLSGNTVTRYFRAADPGATITTNGSGTAANPLDFNDIDSLGTALQTAFGTSTITINPRTTGTGPATTYQLGFSLANTSQSMTFYQTTDKAVGTPADPGAAFDFVALFGKQQAAASNAYNVIPTRSNLTQGTNTYDTTTFGAVGGAATGADLALQARLEAANFFRQTLYGLDNIVKDASLPGYANILKAEKFEVNLNDTGDVKQTIQLSKKSDPPGLGFVGYAVNGGAITADVLSNNFATDPKMDDAVTQINAALTALKQNQVIIAAAKTAMSSRLDYNKTVVTTLSSGATSMTAADSNQEAANLAALQNRQAFAVNNMSSTKQAEQSLIQILR